jgi:hypothetical protein
MRQMAARVLQFVVRRSPAHRQSWGGAMLREMDFVDNDWAAVRWALGSAASICRHSLFEQPRTWRVQAIARWTASMLSGVAVAGAVLTMSVLMLVVLMRASWFAPAHEKVIVRLFIVVIPEAVYLLSAAALWRPKRRIACGILAVGVILVTHSIFHLVTSG